MNAWKVLPGQEPEPFEYTDALKAAGEVIGRPLDFTRGVFGGKLCTIAVDDCGALDGLPVNEVATNAYHANCIPGTTWQICGPVVIFDGLLP